MLLNMSNVDGSLDGIRHDKSFVTHLFLSPREIPPFRAAIHKGHFKSDCIIRKNKTEYVKFSLLFREKGIIGSLSTLCISLYLTMTRMSLEAWCL